MKRIREDLELAAAIALLMVVSTTAWALGVDLWAYDEEEGY